MNGSRSRIAHHYREREPEIGNQRERVSRGPGYGLRRQDGKDLLREIAHQSVALPRGQVAPAQDADVVRGKLGQYARRKTPGLALEQRAQADRDGVELVLRREAVIARACVTREHRSLEGTHTDHHELVQVRAEDGEEPHAREQGHSRIFRQLEHPLVELDPAELGVDQLLRGGAPRIQRGRGPQCITGHAPGRQGRARDVRRGRRCDGGRPLRQGIGPRRHGESGECPCVAQHRRPHARHDLGQREPLQARTVGAREPAGEARGEPDLQRRPDTGRGGYPQPAYLAV